MIHSEHLKIKNMVFRRGNRKVNGKTRQKTSVKKWEIRLLKEEVRKLKRFEEEGRRLKGPEEEVKKL